MTLSKQQQTDLRRLPSIDRLTHSLSVSDQFAEVPRTLIAECCRKIIDQTRHALINAGETFRQDELGEEKILDRIKALISVALRPNLRTVVNGTGIVVHTNLGRSLLSEDAIEAVGQVAGRYSNLEFNIDTGRRGIRYAAIEDILCEISGAEAGMAVNNNAAAVLLCLDTLAKDREVIVSRGELVEIGGAFRIPDVMAKSGAILKEVGTTNRTHSRDYENAIGPNTGLLLKVHTSNYSVVGFTAAVSLRSLVEIAQSHQLPVMEDLGSGSFIDLSEYGITKEPTVQESVAAGADVVTFSGDKLLGGPQAGLIVGKKSVIAKIQKNPLTRALRVDKMTLAALERTLLDYRAPRKALTRIPTLRLLTCAVTEIEAKVTECLLRIQKIGNDSLDIRPIDSVSRIGGGALPLQDLPSKGLSIGVRGMSPNAIERHMRLFSPPIIGRIENNLFILDFRTIRRQEIPIIETAIARILEADTR